VPGSQDLPGSAGHLPPRSGGAASRRDSPQFPPRRGILSAVVEPSLCSPAQLQSTAKASRANQLSTRIQSEEIYRERLRVFWEAAHRNSSNAERIMMDASEDLNILVADEEVPLFPRWLQRCSARSKRRELRLASRLADQTILLWTARTWSDVFTLQYS
jgi:hypothetical protein